MPSQKLPRKVTGIKDDQILVITVPPSDVTRTIEIDAVKQWSNQVRLGVAADREVHIGEPITIKR